MAAETEVKSHCGATACIAAKIDYNLAHLSGPLVEDVTVSIRNQGRADRLHAA